MLTLYHLFSKHFCHDEYFEFTIYAISPQQAFDLEKKYAEKDPDSYYYFNEDITNWDIEEVTLSKPKVIQDSILYG